MERFVAPLKVEHYRRVLANESDPGRRQLVLRLLAEEEAKLATLESSFVPAVTPKAPSGALQDEHISQLNLGYYRKRLETETDMVIRQILIRLISDEETTVALQEVRKAGSDD